MEVHAHTHTERKKFTHYLWEFLMLFLAVFCGFIAENLREHYIEHQKEKQYMQSMIEDLSKDTSMLSQVERRSLSIIGNIDSTLNILQNKTLEGKDILVLYRTNLRTLSNSGPNFTDRTSVQLKNSGSMRLIRKTTVANEIVDYWNKTLATTEMNETIDNYKIKAREKSYSIFNQKYYYNDNNGHTFTTALLPELMTKDLLILTEYANRLSHIKNLISNVYLPQLKVQKESAKNLVNTIKSQYHLH